MGLTLDFFCQLSSMAVVMTIVFGNFKTVYKNNILLFVHTIANISGTGDAHPQPISGASFENK